MSKINDVFYGSSAPSHRATLLTSTSTHKTSQEPQYLRWQTGDLAHSIRWQSQAGWVPPKKIIEIDDTLSADRAYRLASEGNGLVWRGDFQHAKQLLQALKRRLNQRPAIAADLPLPERFHRIRLARAQAARTLGQIIIVVEPGYHLRLKRTPDIEAACEVAYDQRDHAFAVPLTELMGVLSAYQWQTQGVWVEPLKAHIYPRHGVFAPTRQEYLNLLDQALLPKHCHTAFDIGTGTGVVAALLAKKGVERIVATDVNPSALVCAEFNMQNLGLGRQVSVMAADLFPNGRADLVVCNPPWLPGKVNTPLDAAIYDPDSAMLKAFIQGVGDHLNPNGQAWLILSDLAEHLQLRSRETLLGWFEAAGLHIIAQHAVKPSHPKTQQIDDPLHFERNKEVTSLWQLSVEKA